MTNIVLASEADSRLTKAIKLMFSNFRTGYRYANTRAEIRRVAGKPYESLKLIADRGVSFLDSINAIKRDAGVAHAVGLAELGEYPHSGARASLEQLITRAGQLSQAAAKLYYDTEIIITVARLHAQTLQMRGLTIDEKTLLADKESKMQDAWFELVGAKESYYEIDQTPIHQHVHFDRTGAITGVRLRHNWGYAEVDHIVITTILSAVGLSAPATPALVFFHGLGSEIMTTTD